MGSILFIGVLPEPLTGQSLACQVLLNSLQKHHDVRVIDMRKGSFKQGINSLTRVLEVGRSLFSVWRHRHSAQVIYLTPSQSPGGNLRDLLIYALCLRRLSGMVIHLLGGTGMRRILLGSNGLRRRLNEFCLAKVGVVVVEGSRNIEIFARVVPTERIQVVTNFAEDELFCSRASIDTKFAHTRPLKVLFLSNLIPGKGYVELVEAFSMLNQEDRCLIQIDFAGGFEDESQQQEFLRRIGRYDEIRYHGIVRGSTKQDLFHAAHVFCLPTYYPYEGLPFSILEAYASGCAVITTNHSAIPDVFVDEVNGFQVAKRSPEALKEILQRAITETSRLHSMAIDNLMSAEVNYRRTNYETGMMNVFNELLGH